MRERSRRIVELSTIDEETGKPETVIVRRLTPKELRQYNNDECLPMAKLRAIKALKERGEEPGEELALTEEDAAQLETAMYEMVRIALVEPKCYADADEAEANDGITIADLGLDFLRVSEAVTELAYGTEEERAAAARFRTK